MMSLLISAIAARLTSPTNRYIADGRVYKLDNPSDNESLVG